MSVESPQTQKNGQSVNDQEIQFKKRARRRLVGAVALVLLMVAVLPMILDDRQDKTPPQEIAISIPSQDGAEFTSKIVPVHTQDTVAADDAAVDSSADTLAGSDLDAPTSGDLASGKQAYGDQKNASQKIPEPIQPEIKRAEPSHLDASNSAAEKAAAKPVSPVKKEVVKIPAPVSNAVSRETMAKPAPDKQAEDKKASSPASGPAYVQIGVFSDAANIKQLQQKLANAGLKSFTEKITMSAGEKTRLRAGPFTTRAEAENALSKIKAAGMTGMVVSK